MRQKVTAMGDVYKNQPVPYLGGSLSGSQVVPRFPDVDNQGTGTVLVPGSLPLRGNQQGTSSDVWECVIPGKPKPKKKTSRGK